jgi:phosphoribosyl-AMP cyclohydrolase
MVNEDELTYNSEGLIPAVVQDCHTKRVLMVAWMNKLALRRSRETKLAHFWSRSRKELWQKGETSGNYLSVKEIRVDCDADTLLVIAEPAGPTCHTGHISCFYQNLELKC